MTVAHDMSQSDLIADLESSILDYLRTQQPKSVAAAADVISAIRKQYEFLSTTPIVTAIWDLSAKSQIEIDGDWNITLRDRAAALSTQPRR